MFYDVNFFFSDVFDNAVSDEQRKAMRKALKTIWETNTLEEHVRYGALSLLAVLSDKPERSEIIQ